MVALAFLESVQANGILEPLEVVKRGRRYRILSGHRRFAATEAGRPFVPVRIVNIPERVEPGASYAERCSAPGRPSLSSVWYPSAGTYPDKVDRQEGGAA